MMQAFFVEPALSLEHFLSAAWRRMQVAFFLPLSLAQGPGLGFATGGAGPPDAWSGGGTAAGGVGCGWGCGCVTGVGAGVDGVDAVGPEASAVSVGGPVAFTASMRYR